MKTISSHLISRAIMLSLFALLISQRFYAQTPDSMAQTSLSHEALQFQLIGGLGICYIGDWSPIHNFRIGADVSLNRTSQSGNGTAYIIYTSGNSSTSTREPDRTSTSYMVSFSGLYLQRMAEYKHTILYAGLGPIISYSWDRSKIGSTYETSNVYTINYTNVDENTTKVLSIGPLAILGVRSRLVDHISLNAEIEFSAVYQWTTETNSNIYTSHYSNPYSDPSTSKDGSSSHLTGWADSISPVRIGLIVEL